MTYIGYRKTWGIRTDQRCLQCGHSGHPQNQVGNPYNNANETLAGECEK